MFLINKSSLAINVSLYKKAIVKEKISVRLSVLVFDLGIFDTTVHLFSFLRDSIILAKSWFGTKSFLPTVSPVTD